MILRRVVRVLSLLVDKKLRFKNVLNHVTLLLCWQPVRLKYVSFHARCSFITVGRTRVGEYRVTCTCVSVFVCGCVSLVVCVFGCVCLCGISSEGL